jgi:hypothetical protein
MKLALSLCLKIALIAPILCGCKKDCKVCTQMLSEDYYPARDGYPKTTSSSYYSCGSNNSWMGNQVNVQRFILKDTLVTKVLSVDCK